MKFTCKISNENNPNYPIITLRKFYQVIFLEKDFKTLKIYTGVVVGSENQTQRNLLKKNFGLKIEFECKDYNDNSIKIIANHYNKKKSFESDSNAWKAVWGNETELLSNQTDLKTKYDLNYTADDMKNVPANNKNYILIKDNKSTDSNLTSISKIIEINNLSNSTEYKIICNEDLLPNIELANFTFTEIRFVEKIPEHYNYFIEFNKDNSFKAIDNSIYFILPDGYDSKGKEANLFLIDKVEHDPIPNPFQILETDPNKYIQEWIDNGIEERTYYRVYNDSFKTFDSTKKVHKFHFNFRISNSINPLLKQLLYGFLLSLFYSYNLDQTRLIYFKALYWKNELIPADINFILMFTPLFFAILFKVNLGSIRENIFSKYSRYGSYLLTIIWFGIMYWYNAKDLYNSNECITMPIEFSPTGKVLAKTFNMCLIILNWISVVLILWIHKNEIDLFNLKNPFIKKLKKLFNN